MCLFAEKLILEYKYSTNCFKPIWWDLVRLKMKLLESGFPLAVNWTFLYNLSGFL